MIKVYSRNLNDKNKILRKSGYILGVIYGPSLKNTIPIKIPKTSFFRYIENNKSLNIDLLLDNEVKSCTITEIQSQPAFDGYMHISFKCIE